MEESASWPDATDGHVGGYLDAITEPADTAEPLRQRIGAGWTLKKTRTRVSAVGGAGDAIWFRHQCRERTVEREADRKGLDK